MKRMIATAFAVLALAGCNSRKEAKTPAPEAEATLAEPQLPAPTETTSAPSEAPAAPAGIPDAIQGRWGLVPADCTSTRGDAKGLLEIGPDKLKFYESVGTLGKVAETGDTRIRAQFAFTGEGMSWEREEVLDVQAGGDVLIRREYGDDALPGPFRYTRCS